MTAGNILINYAERDTLAILGRVATFASILFGFPLAMLGLKDALTSLLSLPPPSVKPMTLALLLLIATIAVLVKDIGVVVGISGALLGASIVYIFPSLIYRAALAQRRPSGGERGGGSVAEATLTLLTYFLVPLGAFLGVLGVWMTLSGSA